MVETISCILTDVYLSTAETINSAQHIDLGPEVDLVKAASDLDHC